MTDAEIKAERQKVYGDPLKNHYGISQGWAGLLQPCWRMIRDGVPIPPHVVALMMASLKLNRMRRVFHKDNYDDARIYQAFAEEWQAKFEDETLPMQSAWNGYALDDGGNPTEARDQAYGAALGEAVLAMQRAGHSFHWDAKSQRWTYGTHKENALGDWSNGKEYPTATTMAKEVA